MTTGLAEVRVIPMSQPLDEGHLRRGYVREGG
jgi:hypothetical protein